MVGVASYTTLSPNTSGTCVRMEPNLQPSWPGRGLHGRADRSSDHTSINEEAYETSFLRWACLDCRHGVFFVGGHGCVEPNRYRSDPRNRARYIRCSSPKREYHGAQRRYWHYTQRTDQ